MKNVLLSLFILMSLTSCVEVLFEQAQPAGVKAKRQFPTSLRGMYITDEKDTMLIAQYEIKEMSGKQEPDMILSSDLVLKKYKKYYYLNLRNEDGLWEVGVISVGKDGNLNISYIDGSKKEKLQRLKQLVKTTTILNDEEKEDYYVIDPSKKELMKLLKDDIFEKFGEFRKIE